MGKNSRLTSVPKLGDSVSVDTGDGFASGILIEIRRTKCRIRTVTNREYEAYIADLRPGKIAKK